MKKIGIIAFILFLGLYVFMVALDRNTYARYIDSYETAYDVNAIYDDDKDIYEIRIGQEYYQVDANEIIVRYDVLIDHSQFILDVTNYKSKWFNKKRQEVKLYLIMEVSNGVRY